MEKLLKILYNNINAFNFRLSANAAYYSFNNSAEKH